ncbi:MAG: tetratricopeptide repeat protein [Verrucomicrobiaceae bacterium]|nr:tetratricopeptide repeat protein [Verrucomicrobiaceae bacterium]
MSRRNPKPQSALPAPRVWPRWLPGVALMAMTVIVYLPCLNGPLLWDDKDWFGAMDWNLRGWQGLWRLWTVPESLQQYYPVTAMSFWIDHQLWGKWTLPPHLENVLIHGASAVLFWMLLKRLQIRGAWLAAAFFAVHPVMVESVAWMTERKNVLCTFFALATLLAHGKAAGWWESKAGHVKLFAELFAVMLVVMALLSKVSAAVLPGVVMVIGWWRCGTLRWRADGMRVLPWIVVSIPIIWLTSLMEQAQVVGGDWLPSLPFADRLLLAGQLPWFYVSKLLWPAHLCVLYEKWPLAAWQWAGFGMLMVTLAVLVWRRWHGSLALVLLFLGTLFPLLGFFEVNGMKYAWAADRWAYLPAMAVCVGAAFWLVRLPRGVSAALLIACGLLTWRQAGLYASVDGFWQAAVAGSASPWKAHNDYGSQLMDEKRHAEARVQFEAALKSYPEYVAAMVNLAGALQDLGYNNQAIEWLDRAITLHPQKCAVAHYNKAMVFEAMNRAEDAEASFKAAIAQNPDFFAAHNDLGNLLILTGRHDEARECFLKLLELRPDDAKGLTSLGNIHFLRGETSRALDYFMKALQSDPDMTSTLANTAWILATTADDTLRDAPKALHHAKRAAELSKRGDPSILQVLAGAQAAAGDFDQAVATAIEAVKLARAKGNEGLANSIEAMQRQFEQKQPYRQAR